MGESNLNNDTKANNSEIDWKEVFHELYKRNLELLTEETLSAESINEQFSEDSKYHVNEIGTVDIVSGHLEIADPLCYINSIYGIVPKEEIPNGNYPVFISRVIHPVFGVKHLTAKMQITDKLAVRYEHTEPINGSRISGFGVDTGMACFCDHETAMDFDEFLDNWHKQNPDKNLYSDYFMDLFAEYIKIQRGEGSYLDWIVPETNHHVVMFDSGFGDGFYQTYWGFDAKDKICCLIARFIDPKCYEGVPVPKIKAEKQFKLTAEEIKPLLNKEYGYCIATDKITVDGCKVGYMYREEENHKGDSGWRFFEGSEDESYLDDAENSGIYYVNTIANYDPDIIELLDAPIGTAFYRGMDGRLHKDN